MTEGHRIRPTDAAVVTVCLLVVVDGLMTLPYWQFEGNPIVLGLGPLGMISVKLLASAGLLLTYFFAVRGEWSEPYGRPLVWGLLCLYTAVVYSNVLVVLLA